MEQLYLEKFIFPDMDNDSLLYDDNRGSFYDETVYPFHITSEMQLWCLDFEPLTILYGGNGSGKSTILNVISRKLEAKRRSMFNSSLYFDEYVKRCQYRAGSNFLGENNGRSGKKDTSEFQLSEVTTVLTSDDIFKAMLDLRMENDSKMNKSRLLFDDYCNPEKAPRHLNFETGYNVDKFREVCALNKARSNRSTFNKYLVDKLGKLERGFSNGETALMKLSELIEQPGLYLLDEPENSMSCEFQLRLAAIIGYLSTHGNCQFVISTHSPFLLSMKGAKIYNLDHTPVDVCRWWELDNMKLYFDLFDEYRDKFSRK